MSRIRLTAIALAIPLAVMAVGCGDRGPDVEEPPIDVPEADLKALADGNNQFAIELYKKLAAAHDGNIVVSPYSISSALAMTYAGARGETAEEMAKALHFTLPPDRLHPAFADTGRHFTSAAGAGTLDIANALWVQDGLALARLFTDLTKRHYAAGLETVDFGNPEAATKRINGWVAKRTRDKITELLKPGSLGPQTQMVLTNAVYMNCRWATPFPVGQTKDGEFESASGKTMTVPMMRLEDTKFRITSTPDFDMLELPYEGGKLAIWIILPTRRGGLRDVEQKLTAKAVAAAAAELRTGKAEEVAIPRFTARSAFNLNEQLHALGMRRAFTPGADYSGMLPESGVYVGRVIHEAIVEVDERGTVAAAATAVEMVVGLPRKFRFRADHPFLFLITDRASGGVLFLGRCAKPV